jgi:hypothetical protein
MAVSAKQQMADFVCDGGTQDCGYLAVTVRETHRIFVVDSRESRKEGNTEERVLQPIRDAPGKYSKNHVGRFTSLTAQPLWVGGRISVLAV